MKEHEIEVGKCYHVLFRRKLCIAVVTGKLKSNNQGETGPGLWRLKCICSLGDAPVQDGTEIELRHSDFECRATKQDIVYRCLELGWREIVDIQNYLAEFGVHIEYGTIGGYKSKWFNPQRSARTSENDYRYSLAEIEKHQQYVDEIGGQERFDALLDMLAAVRSNG